MRRRMKETRWEELRITNDFLFGKVMRNEEICKELVESILNIKIDKIEYPEEQKTIDISIDAKSIRLDVYVADGKGTIYNLEMQTSDTKELPKRTRYYQGMIDLNLIEKGKLYGELNTSYIIFICTFDPFEQGRHIYSFENRCIEDLNLKLKDGTTKIFLNSAGTKEDVSGNLKEFLLYLAGKESSNKFVEKVDCEVKRAKENKEWRREYMTLLMRDRENIEEGRRQGREEGRKEGRKEIIEKMLEKKLTLEMIAEVTGYSLEEIIEIEQKKIKK